MGACAAKAILRLDERRRNDEFVLDLSKVTLVLTSRETKNVHMRIMDPSASALYRKRRGQGGVSASMITLEPDTSRASSLLSSQLPPGSS